MISANDIVLRYRKLTFWCGQTATKTLEGTDRASFFMNAIDYINGVKMVDPWEERIRARAGKVTVVGRHTQDQASIVSK